VQNVQVPEQVQAAFNDAVKAGRTASASRTRPGLRQRRDPEGARYRRAPEARRPKATARVVAQAEGDAQRFRSVLAEYQKAPAGDARPPVLETMQQVYSNVSKVMVDSRSGGNLLYLPLDKLMQQAGGAPAAGAAAAAAPPPAPVAGPRAATDIRSRDGARTRDREGR
jgi:membrane protease subunit HflK